MNDMQEPATATAAKRKSTGGFSAEERAAMKERAKELKASASREEAEKTVLDAIAEMPESDRAIAERVHAIIRENAPALSPKLWYGQPAYAKDGDVVCFFQNASKFKTRYATLGFTDSANLDDGPMWPTAFGLTKLTPEIEATITELVKRAAS
jgi:uncharacterized protein YdhG (YjbR/CyaY superfamily)